MRPEIFTATAPPVLPATATEADRVLSVKPVVAVMQDIQNGEIPKGAEQTLHISSCFHMAQGGRGRLMGPDGSITAALGTREMTLLQTRHVLSLKQISTKRERGSESGCQGSTNVGEGNSCGSAGGWTDILHGC